ncbi:hydrogenase maturation protease [Roseibium sp. RKSG952]|uniref:hydrogenase maturation protease n=1 Tax=Roseibium sp. RKSG952 TaxID=2529384 RepID=UPI0018AD1ECA|nr:hydrogenase maturation protease [Roseibium sp. RKSG952]
MLLIGYGNPGRGDDGLGPAFSEGMSARGLPGLEVDTDYQLVAEHAFALSEQDIVIFVDAEIGGEDSFSFREILVGTPDAMGSHSLTPRTVLSLCQTLYGTAPRAYVLGISGYEYGEVKEGLSERAKANLAEAEAFFLDWQAEQTSNLELAHA